MSATKAAVFMPYKLKYLAELCGQLQADKPCCGLHHSAYLGSATSAAALRWNHPSCHQLQFSQQLLLVRSS